MMIKTLLKAAGFNPEQFAQGVSGFISDTQARIVDFDARLRAMEIKAQESHAMLLALHTALVGTVAENTTETCQAELTLLSSTPENEDAGL